MSDSSPLNIGLLGVGVVGGGVAQALADHVQSIRRRAGRPVALRRALVRDPGKPRPPAVTSTLITTNPEDILGDPDIGLVVEVMGGEDPAFHYMKSALSTGKHVVTANKEVIAKHGPELLSLANEKGVRLLFEASVGGGIPIIGCLLNQLQANDVRSIRGIINGTTNYILTRMAYARTSFGQALKEAQERGYAEADPTNDVEGIDAVYKLSILASLGFNHWVAPHQVYRQGISNLEPQDFRYAQELGYAIKSLAIATLVDGVIQARVYPALIPQDHMLAKVDGVYNAVEVEGDLCGPVVFHGMGAGRAPTTSAVVGDIIEIGRGLSTPSHLKGDGALTSLRRVEPIDSLESKYYFRLTVADQAGVLAQISRILGEGNISLAAVLQKDNNPAEQTAEIVITTHPAQEASVQSSLDLVSRLEVVHRVDNLLRIED